MVLGLTKRKIYGRPRRARFIYRVQLLDIKPWLPPQQAQPISADSFVLRWHRGTHRSGLAQSNITYRAKADVTIPFNHILELPVTLHCSPSSPTFEEKLIIFTLLDAQYSAGPPLARGSLNLSAYGASGIDINEPVTTTARVPLVLCRHVTSKAVIPHLHILITPSLCKRACFGEGECQSKAHSIIRYLPMQTVRLLKKREVNPPPLDSSSREALISALLKEEEEHQEEEEEAEIEPFTDDESSSGLQTPHEETSSSIHPKTNIAAFEDNIVGEFNSPPLSSRITADQFAWTPTPRRHGLDEAMAPLKTASDYYNSSKEDLITLFRDSSGVLSSAPPSSTVNARQHDSSTLQTVACVQYDADLRVGHLVERRGTSPPENQHDQCMLEPADPKMQSYPKDKDDTGNHLHATEADALCQRTISQLQEKRFLRLSFEDLDTELMNDYDDILVEEDMNVLEEARRKFAEGAEMRNAKVTKRLLEETKVKLIDAETKLFAASERASFLQLCIGALEGELQDVAIIEMSVFCTVAEHGEPPHSILTCAYNLAKLYNHAIIKWSPQRRASLIKSAISGLLLATEACGHDVARLTFWWSNVLALRHALLSTSSTTLSDLSRSVSAPALDAAKGCSLSDPKMHDLGDTSAVYESDLDDVSDVASFSTALERLEASIYVKVVEAVWSQVFAPLTHKAASSSLQQGGSSEDAAESSKDQEIFDLEDGMQQNASIDIWKKAFLDALERLCPVLFGGKSCSCISGLPRWVIEECVARLDVLMFNAILPIPTSDASMKPISNVVFDAELLPIPPGHMTFGAGMQLKNVVGTWSTWLTILLEKLTSSTTNAANDDSRRFISFPLLKALADLLMLPRDMVADKSVRKEVCPVLALAVVRRIISMVEPDDFAPDAVSPSLLAALNAEIDMEKRMLGDVERHGFSLDGMALEPRVVYRPHSTTFKELVKGTLDSTISKWATQDGSARDVLYDLKTMFGELLQTFSEIMPGRASLTNEVDDLHKDKSCGVPLHRYKLLEEMWDSHSTGEALVPEEDLRRRN